MRLGSPLIGFSLNRPGMLTGIMLSFTLILALMAALPSLWPYSFGFLNPLQVDTDPENMLAETEPVREFHDRMKKEFNLHDMVVVGVVNDEQEHGVFNTLSLHRIYALTQYVKTMHWPDPEEPGARSGVILSDLIAPSSVDNVEQGGLGEVKFEWLMPSPPLTEDQAVEIRDNAKELPFLDGTLLSEDGQALGVYAPLSSKDLSHRIYTGLQKHLPLLWQWGPVNQELRRMEALQSHPKALRTLQQLGRLAAFYSQSKQDFQVRLQDLGSLLSRSNPSQGWEKVRQAAESWSSQASELQAAHQSEIQATRGSSGEKRAWALEISLAAESNRALKSHLEQAAPKDASSWLSFAALYVDSLRHRMLNAEELVQEVKGFAERMKDGLSQAPDLSGLQQTVSSTLSAYSEFPGSDVPHITGLPVAEDTFGVEMFKQMAISAPMAMLVIFILLLFFFRKLLLVLAPMIVAMVAVITTMGLLVATGNKVHIMSSMIPIFIMPIAVLDSVHILSEFFDRYAADKGRRKTTVEVMDALFQPMLFTSLTTAAGFASLALTPIPPVQVFGLFVAFGVIMAWLWTILFIPAYIMFIPEHRLENFGLQQSHGEEDPGSPLSRLLRWIGGRTYVRAKLVLGVVVVVLGISVYGINLIVINDNPIKWFTKSHPIRIADRVLNEHFGGTYMAYLTLLPPEKGIDMSQYAAGLSQRLREKGAALESEMSRAKQAFDAAANKVQEAVQSDLGRAELLQKLEDFALSKRKQASLEASYVWGEVLSFLDTERQRRQYFKQPQVLRYIEDLQKHLLSTGEVGKSNSLSDIVKTVHRELLGQKEAFRIPDTARGVAQCLITYQNSHRPQDLWHFTTTDYQKGNIWIQLKSGDNKDMSRVVQAVRKYVQNNPPPFGLQQDWFGLTYINVIWQNKMVSGMLQAFLGSFLVVLFMMSLLFRSALWGVLCMVPLTVTIAFMYGVIGLVGKTYDMPVAVLSSLSLGLAVDYAIHFLARSRQMQEHYGSWKEAVAPMFGEPARAISRNIIVIGVGFLPLLAAPLVPYKTVGALIASILLIAGVASLLILPALIRILESWLFPATRARDVACKCGTCIVIGLAAVALALVNIHQFMEAGWTQLTWYAVAAIPVLAAICWLMSKRQRCKVADDR